MATVPKRLLPAIAMTPESAIAMKPETAIGMAGICNFAGMRVCEIAALRIVDVYFDNGVVKDKLTLSADQTKGSNGRIVVLNSRLKEVLARYYVQMKLSVLERDTALLQSQKGGRFSANSLCQVLGRLYLKAGLHGCTSHSGRRSFITTLAHKGVSAKVLMTLVGHKHLGTTQRYIDVNDKLLTNAVELL